MFLESANECVKVSASVQGTAQSTESKLPCLPIPCWGGSWGGGEGRDNRAAPPTSGVDLLVGSCLFTRLALLGSFYMYEVKQIKFPVKNLHTEGEVKLHLDHISQSHHCGATGIPLSSIHGICLSLEIDDGHILVGLSRWLEELTTFQ